MLAPIWPLAISTRSPRPEPAVSAFSGSVPIRYSRHVSNPSWSASPVSHALETRVNPLAGTAHAARPSGHRRQAPVVVHAPGEDGPVWLQRDRVVWRRLATASAPASPGIGAGTGR